MISCSDFLHIHKQLSKVFPDKSLPFGGKSVILAGDFAQLPPAGRSPALYSNAVGAYSSGHSQTRQNYALGKALWHQVTTIVILRENMRQRGMSAEDLRFKCILERMCYGCCTADDIEFLQTRVCRPALGDDLLREARFRSVSMITAQNAHRDTINSL